MIISSALRFTLKMILPCKWFTRLLHVGTMPTAVRHIPTRSGNFWCQFVVFCPLHWQLLLLNIWGGGGGPGGAMCGEQCQICLELKAKTTTCPNAISDCYWKHCLKWPIQSSKPIVEPVVGYMSSVSAASLPSMLSLMQCNRLYVPVKLSYLIILSISKNVLELRPCELLYNPNLSDFSQVAEQVRNY